jgi:hypothetical protein
MVAAAGQHDSSDSSMTVTQRLSDTAELLADISMWPVIVVSADVSCGCNL